MRTLFVALLLALTADVALAQQPTAGLVLMVEDQPRPEAERMGVALYDGILRHGPYAERVLVQGRDRANTRLARAIVAVASRREVVDVVIAMHTIRRESTLFVRMALTLPGTSFGPDDLPTRVLEGSRPVVSGDFTLRISDGLGRTGRLPPALQYDRRRGGPLGLALRALAGRFEVSGEDAMTILRSIDLPLPVAADTLQIERLSVEAPGSIVLRLAEPQTIPLERGFTLHLDRELRLTPGTWDPVARRTALIVEGVRVGWGILRATPVALALEPEPGERPGYRVRFLGSFLMFPVMGAVHVGGTDPSDAPIAAPLRAEIRRGPATTPAAGGARETPATTGFLGAIGRALAAARGGRD